MKKKVLDLLLVIFINSICVVQAQWIQTNGPNGGRILCMAANGTHLFAGTYGGGVYLSTNNGTNWTAVNNGLTNTEVNSLVVSNMNLFAGAYYEGVYLTTNNGTNWTAFNNGLSKIVTSLAVSTSNLFAGTSNAGVFRRPLSEIITSIDDKQNNLPTSFSLQQNYPNPFNPITIINYSIPKTCFVTIKIYDVLGRGIETLVNENKTQGNYSLAFNASKLVSGIYLYRMDAGSFTETKKLLLLK
ncbi:MAG: hypothetical protein A2V66_18040 [Ignavibacteria bacterium RBG_13_36_8]|nr:MAG: hypothetical protein A2V66_18040 [Ignavibacteria bacterium RBG_13_36_8]